MADSGYLDFPTAVPPIAWDVHAVYTFYNGTWGITPRYTSCWNDVTATFRPLLMDKPMEWTRPDGTEDVALKLLQRQVALGNLGIAHATTESYGLVKYTEDWTDDGTGDPEEAPLTLTRNAVAGMLAAGLAGKQDKLTAGRGITISANNVISATGGGGGGDVTSDGDNEFTGSNAFRTGVMFQGSRLLHSPNGIDLLWNGDIVAVGSDVAREGGENYFTNMNWFDAGVSTAGATIRPSSGGTEPVSESGFAGASTVQFVSGTFAYQGLVLYNERPDSVFPCAFSLMGGDIAPSGGWSVLSDNASLHVCRLHDVAAVNIRDTSETPLGDTAECLTNVGGTLYWNGDPVGGGPAAPIELYDGIVMRHGGRYVISSDVFYSQSWGIEDGAEAEIRIIAGVATVAWPSDWRWSDYSVHPDYGVLFSGMSSQQPSWPAGSEVIVKVRGSSRAPGSASAFAHVAVTITP